MAKFDYFMILIAVLAVGFFSFLLGHRSAEAKIYRELSVKEIEETVGVIVDRHMEFITRAIK